MANPTIYPFRQALTIALQSLVTGAIVPALNASLAAQFAAQKVPESDWVSFSADQVRVGDAMAGSDPVICIMAGKFENELLGTRTFAATYFTDLVLKLPAAADNAPEDFEMVQQAYVDAMMDGLTGGDAAYNLNPNLSSAIKPLPAGSVFRDCFPVGGAVLEPDKLADGVTMVRRCAVTHTATISFTLDRPDSLGGG
jgi:hypothetical protein